MRENSIFKYEFYGFLTGASAADAETEGQQQVHQHVLRLLRAGEHRAASTDLLQRVGLLRRGLADGLHRGGGCSHTPRPERLC